MESGVPLGKGNPTAVIEQVAILLAKAPWLRLCTQIRRNLKRIAEVIASEWN